MPRMVIELSSQDKRNLRQLKKATRDKTLSERCQIVLLAGKHRKRERIAESVGCSVSWVGTVLRRTALPAAVLSATQRHRTHRAGPARQRDSQPPLPLDGRTAP